MPKDYSDQAFKVWMGKVDAILIRKIGMGHQDLPDACYRDFFDDGLSPSTAASVALEECEHF